MHLPMASMGLLTTYLAPFVALAGDRRTGRLIADIVHGIIGSESLVCTRIAALSPCAGGQSPC